MLVDRFLEDAIEVDVDALRDATGEVVIGGVMEHIEEAGVHSGDSACAIPPQTLAAEVVAAIEAHTRALADALDVRGLLNVQYAVKDGELYVIEANPRASRTVPFVSKATGVPLAKVAAAGDGRRDPRRAPRRRAARPPADGGHIAVKEAVLPFNRFPDVDTVLGPEMRSTGEVMGIDRTFGMAFAKSQTAAGNRLPREGTVFLSLADRDKAVGPGRGAPVRRARLLARGHRRHRGRARGRGARGRGGRRQAHGERADRTSRRGRADCVGEGRPRGEHAARPRAPGRRRPHPPHRHRPRDPVPHHRGRRAGGVGRDRRVVVDARPTVRSLQEYHRDGQLRLGV